MSNLKSSDASDMFRDSNQILGPIIAACPHAIIAVDRDRKVRIWNAAATRIFGWAETEVLGKSVPFVAADQRLDSETLNERALHGESFHNLEVRRNRRDGSSVDCLVSAAPTLDEQGNIDGFVTVSTDITEKKALELQFLRGQRLESLGTLASGIAHDLNNVLAPIQMSLELIQMKVADPGVARILDTLNGSVERGAGLVRQILTFARGVKGDRVVLQTGPVVRDIVKVLCQTMPRSIAVKTDMPDDLWPISADLTQLHQVLMNLCVNSRDAMPEGGKLSITAQNVVVDDVFVQMIENSSISPHVCFEVKDSGTGIPPEIRNQIFQPFFTTKEVGEGTGLGLSTVASIVRAHGGFVNVYSEAGRGTSFKVYWPAESVEGQQLEAKDRSLPAGNGELILIVDDESAVRDIAGMALESHGYRVLHAQDGADGVAVFAQNLKEIRLVISDMDMPIMNGAAMIRSLERIDPKVRVLSASGLTADRPAAEPLNSLRRVLPKPYTAAQLLTAVHELMAVN